MILFGGWTGRWLGGRYMGLDQSSGARSLFRSRHILVNNTRHQPYSILNWEEMKLIYLTDNVTKQFQVLEFH